MENTTDLNEFVASKRRDAINTIRKGLMEKIAALQNELNNLDEYELQWYLFEKNDETLATIVDKTDKNSFWPLMRKLLESWYMHEFYDVTWPGEYPFGPGRINTSPEQGLDSPKLAWAVKKKWYELIGP